MIKATMEKFLTDCLLNMSSDVKKFEELKSFLHSAWKTEKYYMFSYQIVKAVNDVLKNFTLQKSPETELLDIIIDSLHFVVIKNKKMSFWNNFGFQLGESFVKIISLIEKTESFEVLFGKILTIINKTSEDNSNLWKSVSRQILNVFINKNLSFEFMENAFTLYISNLKKIEKTELNKFAEDNLSLLKTFFTKAQCIGDYQIQESILKLVFFHFHDKSLIYNFFPNDKQNIELFINLNNFENASRKYLNEMNKKTVKRKVSSVGCLSVTIGGRTPLTLNNKKLIWVDINKDTQRISINKSDLLSNKNITIPFSSIRKFENEKTIEGLWLITITCKMHEHGKNEIVVLRIPESAEEDVVSFNDCLYEFRKSKKKLGHKLSQTCDLILINREEFFEVDKKDSSKKIQIHAVSSSIENDDFKSGKKSINFFTDSLNKNLELRNLDKSQTFKPQTSESGTKKTHKLFRSPLKTLNGFNTYENTLNKNKNSPNETETKKKKRKLCLISPSSEYKKKYEAKVFESPSSSHFRSGIENEKKKPLLPKFKIKSARYFSNVKKTEKNRAVQEPKITKPSLLDPNGYAYQRWLQPTTSQRSNFWLEKLKSLEKEKHTLKDEFEFCEKSDDEEKKKGKFKNGANGCRTKVQNRKKKMQTVKTESKIVPPKKVKNNFLDDFQQKDQETSKKIEKVSFKTEVRKEEEKVVRNLFTGVETEPKLKKTEKSFEKKGFKLLENQEEAKNKSFDEEIFKRFETMDNQQREEMEPTLKRKMRSCPLRTSAEREFEEVENQQKEEREPLKEKVNINEEIFQEFVAANRQNEEMMTKNNRSFAEEIFNELGDVGKQQNEELAPVSEKNNRSFTEKFIVAKQHKQQDEESTKKNNRSFVEEIFEVFKKGDRQQNEEIETVLEENDKSFEDVLGQLESVVRKRNKEMESVSEESNGSFKKKFMAVKQYKQQNEEITKRNNRTSVKKIFDKFEEGGNQQNEEVEPVLEENNRSFGEKFVAIQGFRAGVKPKQQYGGMTNKNNRSFVKKIFKKCEEDGKHQNEEVDSVLEENNRSFGEEIFGKLEPVDRQENKELNNLEENNRSSDEELFGEFEQIDGQRNTEIESVLQKNNGNSDEEIFGDFEVDEAQNTEMESVLEGNNKVGGIFEEDEQILRGDDSEEEDVDENHRKQNEYSWKNKTVLKNKLEMLPVPFRIKIIQAKIEKAEEKAHKETDEILETVKKATNNIFSKLQKKESAKVVSYLRLLEEVGPELSDTNHYQNQALWLQKFKAFYESRCCATHSQKEVMKIRNALEELKENTASYSTSVKKMNEKLKEIMKKGIEGRMEDEAEERKRKLKGMKQSWRILNRKYFI